MLKKPPLKITKILILTIPQIIISHIKIKKKNPNDPKRVYTRKKCLL